MRTMRDAIGRAPGELVRYRHLREQLLAQIPDLDAETLADTLEGVSDLPQMLGEIVRSASEDEALATGLATRLSEMRMRLDRLETRAQRKRELALRFMSDAKIDKLAEADFTASLRQGVPGLEIVAEERIPQPYWKPQPPKLDRQGLLAALKTGAMIEGVALAAPKAQLSVRTK